MYAFNILIQMGALPQVTYFESPRRDTFDSLEAGVEDFSRMLEHGNEDKIDRLRDYVAQHMIENPHAGEPGSKGRAAGTLHARPRPQGPLDVYCMGAGLFEPSIDRFRPPHTSACNPRCSPARHPHSF